MRLGLLGGKGGVGKSTLSLNLAHALTLAGARTLLVDADPQGTVGHWLEVRDAPAPFTVARLDRPVLHHELPGLSKAYDAVVVDGPPRAADILRSAFLACSHVLLPVQPSGPDLWGQLPVIELRKEALPFLPVGQHVAFVISRRIVGTALGKGFRDQIADLGLPVLAGTSQRIAYAEAITAGQTVFELDSARAAAAEINSLLTDIRSL